MRDQHLARELMLADLAARQYGVVASWQLRNLGFDKRAVHRRVRAGRLHPIHRGVYAVGHARITRDGRWMAAVLACGRLAFLSHRTAAAHWGLLRPGGGAVHVTVPATGRAKRDGIVLHESADVADHGTRHEEIPVTTVARTLLDLAAAGDRLLDRAIEESEHLGLFDLKAVDAVTASPRPGVRTLRRALAIYRPVPDWDRSHFERRVLKALRDDGVPDPALNMWLLGAERDLVWVDHGLVVELDGPWHEGTAARIRDPQRDATLQLHGYSVVRVPQHWFDTDPAGVVQTIRDFLSRGARTPARPGR